MTRRSFILAPLLLLLALGCSGRFRLKPERLAQPSDWPYHRGSIAGLGSIEESGFTGHLDILWEQQISDKPSGPLTLSHGTLIYPGAKRRIRFFDQADGDYLGQWRTKQSVQTGLVLLDSLAFYGTSPPHQQVCCLDLKRRKRLWRRRVKDGAAGTIIVDNRLIVASGDGRLVAFDVDSGEPLWSLETPGRLVAGPSGVDGRIYQPVDNGTLLAVAVDDGRELSRVELDEPLTAGVAVGDLVYAVGMHGSVFAVNGDDGRIVWRTSLGGDSWTAPAVSRGRVFVGLSSGRLVALDAATGEELWRFSTVEVVRASATAVGGFVVVGTMAGKLFSLEAATGAVIDQRQMDGAIAVPPVTDGRRLYVATDRGEITCFGDAHDEISRLNQRSHPGHRPERTGPQSEPRPGHGLSQSLDLRLQPPHGGAGAGETVSRP